MAKQSSKAVALSVAASLMGFGAQQLTAGEQTTGIAALVAGLVVFVGYQYAEDNDHGKAYDDIIEAVGGEETLKKIAETSGEELDELLEEARRNRQG